MQYIYFIKKQNLNKLYLNDSYGNVESTLNIEDILSVKQTWFG